MKPCAKHFGLLPGLLALLLSLPVLFPPGSATARSWPEQKDAHVTDDAGLITPADEATLRRWLSALREERGVEFTILTLPDRAPFQSAGSYEDFSIGLFNAWGIGNPEKNDGILLLVLHDSREMSIELGAGHDASYNAIAGEIVDTILVPAFREGRYSQGIVEGADAIMRRIADYTPPAAAPAATAGSEDSGGAAREAAGEGAGANAEEDSEAGGFSPLKWGLGLLLALGLGWGIFGRRLRNAVARCESCGQRGLNSERRIVEPATQEHEGRGEIVTTCPHCGHVTTTGFTIARLADPDRPKDEEKGKFSGGSSSGGGASGKW